MTDQSSSLLLSASLSRAEVQRAFNKRLKEHNLATGTWKIGDAEKGWQVALRFALADVAQNKLMEHRTLAGKRAHGTQPTLPLFED